MLDMPEKELRTIRGSEISMIFQEPMTSLNPLFTVGDQLMEIVRVHNPGISKAEAYSLALQAVTDVRIPNPERILDSYPCLFTFISSLVIAVL